MKKYLDASYTIEAALILPMVFITILAVIFLAFYVHDNTVLNQIAFETAFWGARNPETTSDERIKAFMEGRLERALTSSTAGQCEIKRNKNKIEVIINAKYEGAFLKKHRRIVKKQSVQEPEAADYIRRILVTTEKIRKIWEE